MKSFLTLGEGNPEFQNTCTALSNSSCSFSFSRGLQVKVMKFFNRYIERNPAHSNHTNPNQLSDWQIIARGTFRRLNIKVDKL